MGYKNECKKALIPGQKVTVFHGVYEFNGKVVDYDSQVSRDYSVVIEEDDGNRALVPLSGGNPPTIKFKPTKKQIQDERNELEIRKKEKSGDVPK